VAANPASSADAEAAARDEYRSSAASIRLRYLRHRFRRKKPDDPTGWKTAGGAWTASLSQAQIAPAARTYADIGRRRGTATNPRLSTKP